VADIWLDGAYSVELRDASNNLIWERDDVEAPSELPSQTGNAGRYLQTDATSTTWEIVQALPDYSGATDGDVVKISGGFPVFGPATFNGNFAGAELTFPVLVNARDKAQSVVAAATTTISYPAGAVVQLSQDVNIGTLSFTSFGAANQWARMVIIRTKDATATPRTIAWGSIRWAGGTAPTLSSTASAVDIIELWSNGTTVYGFSRGAAFA
jgi:hypothetical protein